MSAGRRVAGSTRQLPKKSRVLADPAGAGRRRIWMDSSSFLGDDIQLLPGAALLATTEPAACCSALNWPTNACRASWSSSEKSGMRPSEAGSTSTLSPSIWTSSRPRLGTMVSSVDAVHAAVDVDPRQEPFEPARGPRGILRNGDGGRGEGARRGGAEAEFAWEGGGVFAHDWLGSGVWSLGSGVFASGVWDLGSGV